MAYADEDFRSRPKIRLELPGVEMYALVDTGASMTCLRSDIARTVLQSQGRPYSLMKHDVPLLSVTGNAMLTEGEIELCVDKVGPVRFIVVKNMTQGCLIGWDQLKCHGWDIDTRNGVI